MTMKERWLNMNPLLRTPRVVHLFRLRCPSDVARFVVAVVVRVAINGMSGRRRISDVLVKGRKVFAPFFANTDASAAIMPILRAPWIVATSPHTSPRSEDFRLGHSVSGPWFILLEKIYFPTSAGTRTSVVKRLTHHPSRLAALTNAKPIESPFISIVDDNFKFVGNSPITNGLPNQIFEVHGN
jgi:hypothetical protein